MRETCANLRTRAARCILLFLAFITLSAVSALCAGDDAEYINGFHVRSLPASYDAQERFLSSLKGSGANTIILDLPMTAQATPDLNVIANAVYLVHQSGFRIYIIMPTRRSPQALEQHPDWEDQRYDLAERSLNRSGNLDLFQDEAVAYLAANGKMIAEYAVDGILLGDDFVYETGDGMGKAAVSVIEQKLHMKIVPKKLFVRIDRKAEVAVVEEYGAGFWQWTEAKRDRLLETYDAIRTSARKVNPRIKIGVPVPVMRPVAVPSALLARYAFDSNAYRTINVDCYWTAIDYRDHKTQEHLSFSESVEFLSRSAYAAVTSVKDLSKMIVVLQASTAAGMALPLSEIEQTTGLVRRAGRTGIVYSITPATVPSAVLTRKMFRSAD